MSDNLNLAITISAVDQASQVLQRVGSTLMNALPGPAAIAVGALAGISAAAIGIGVKSVQMAADFQTGVTSLVTGAGEAQSNIGLVSNGILDLAQQTGTSTQQLISGMYMIESAGYRGAQALDVLKASAEGAKVDNADLGVVTNAVTGILTDYHMSGDRATQATNALIATVKAGKMHMQDLANAMGAVLPTASALGVSFPQVAGAIAVMTNANTSAQQAAQNLSHTLLALSAPNATATKSMKEVGLTAQQVKDTLGSQGLSGAIQLIEQHVGQKFPASSVDFVTATKNIMGGLVGYQTALKVGGANMKAFEGNVSSISGALHQGGSAVQGWSLVQGTFNQQMSQAKEAVEVLMIRIGTALLPVVTKLVAQIAPLVARFADWLVKSGTLDTIARGLGATIAGLATGISKLVTFVSQVVGFFQKYQVAADGLKAVLAGLAVGLAVWLATLLPGLIAGFIAWAGAALAAAAATLLAAAPFILIGAVVALVVFGIIEAVRHWGAISHWLLGVWQGVVNWFHSTLGSIGAFFTSVWHGIQSGLQAAWNVIVNIARVGGMLLLVAILGPFLLIGAAFVWLYNHNTYFKLLIDTIVGFVKTGVAWLHSAWQAVVTFIAGLWDWLRTHATAVWTAVSTAISSAVQAVITWLHSIWTAATTWLSQQWNRFADLARAAWQAVSSVFASIWSTYIATPMQNLWNALSSWFSTIANQAVSWGANIIHGIISGITGMLGSIGQAASNVAGTIAKFLGFHSPAEEGPGSHLMEWPKNMVATYAQQLIAQAPTLSAAVNVLARPLNAMGTPGATNAVRTTNTSTTTNGGASVSITINAPTGRGTDIANTVKQAMGDMLRGQANLVTITSGGTR